MPGSSIYISGIVAWSLDILICHLVVFWPIKDVKQPIVDTCADGVPAMVTFWKVNIAENPIAVMGL